MSQPKARTEVLDAVVDSFVTADAQDAKRRDIMNSLLGPDGSKKVSQEDDLFSGASVSTPSSAPAPCASSEIKSVTREAVSAHEITPREIVQASSPSAQAESESPFDAGVDVAEAKVTDVETEPEAETEFAASASPAASAPPVTTAAPLVSSAALTSPIDPSSKPSAVAAAAVGQRPAPRAARTAPAPEPTAPAPKPSFFNSFLEKMADFFDPGDTPQTAAETRAAAIAVQRKRQARQGRALGRVRTQALTAALLETFARLDADKDGFVTKDEAWKHLLRCGHFRTAPLVSPPPPFEDVPESSAAPVATESAATAPTDTADGSTAVAAATIADKPATAAVRAVLISDDAWVRIKDEYEDALSELPEFLLSHDDWVDTFGDIDVDNATLATMIESGRVYADLS